VPPLLLEPEFRKEAERQCEIRSRRHKRIQGGGGSLHGRQLRYFGASVHVPIADLATAARCVGISMYSTRAQRSANER
jgi:hypothetical protein